MPTAVNKRRDPFFDWAVFKPKLYLWSILTVVILTYLGLAWKEVITPIDQALIYLTGVVLVAAKFGRGPSFLYSFLSVSCFNFFFIPPIYTFDVYDRSYWLTFFVMLITGFVIASQASRLRLQLIFSRRREHETEAFYTLTRELASARSRQDIANVAAKHIATTFSMAITIWLADNKNQLRKIIGQLPPTSLIKETSVLQWCFDHNEIAGYHTATMPTALGLYFPLSASSGILGVLGVIIGDEKRELSADDMSALGTCASLLASTLERVNIAEIAEKSRIETESEKLRAMLLSSLSHDLRTPLASITGAASTITTDIDQLSIDTIRDLGRSINKEAERLTHIVNNLLEVTRLESGTVQLNNQPYFIEELIGSALERLEPALSKHILIPKSEENLPLVLADGVLIEQALTNLLENAVRYTPEGSVITISAVRKGTTVLIGVADNGPGILPGSEKKIFDKFYSIHHNNTQKGSGLGLAICASIIKAHHGKIWAENRSEGGACFYFTLPIAEDMTEGIQNVANA